jgi:tripeptide aminopeptidase
MIHPYEGADIVLPHDNIIIPAADLTGLEGKSIITADGTSLLGADDKAGVAALVTLAESLLAHRPVHGPVTLWFCVDEEIGEVGVKFLPEGVADQWDVFWTVDGKELSTVDIGCFYGAKILVQFVGNDAHPGVAGSALRPAHYAAADFLSLLAIGPTPWTTSGEEPFIYVPALSNATAGKTDVIVYPRTFNPEDFPGLHTRIEEAATAAARRFGVEVKVGETEVMYVSTEAAISAKPHLVEPGLTALRECGFPVKTHRIRAGTDGAMLNKTYPGIPAPNLGTGSGNLHGCREFLVEDQLWQVPDVLRDMVGRYAAMTR